MKNIDEMVVLRQEEYQITKLDLMVEVFSSSVTLTESPDGKTRVLICSETGALAKGLENVEISQSDGRVRVTVDKGLRGFQRMKFVRSTNLTVVVQTPSDSKVSIRTVSGDVEVQESVSKLDIASVSGDLSVLKNPRGKCSIKTVSGDIDVTAISGCQFDLKSVSGDITVKVGAGLEIDVDGSTVSGDLGSEIPLSTGGDGIPSGSELVKIHSSTVSGDFSLSRQ